GTPQRFSYRRTSSSFSVGEGGWRNGSVPFTRAGHRTGCPNFAALDTWAKVTRPLEVSDSSVRFSLFRSELARFSCLCFHLPYCDSSPERSGGRHSPGIGSGHERRCAQPW